MSRRNEQISSVLREAIQEFIARGLNDPRVGGLVTVTAVKVADDLKNADVMISVFPEEKQELAIHGLRHAATHIRRQVSDKVALRQIPQFHFKLDRSLKKQAEVLRALAQAAETTPPAPPDSPEPPTPADAAAGAPVNAGDMPQTSSAQDGAKPNEEGNNPSAPPPLPADTSWPAARRHGGAPEQEKSS